MATEHVAVIVAAGITWVGFTLAMRLYFRGSRKRSPAKTVLTASAAITTLTQIVAVIVLAPPAPWCAWVGVAGYALANLVYWSSLLAHGKARPAFAFLPVTPQGFTQAGPYRWIRHPIYSAYLLGWLVGPIVTGQPFLLLTVAWMGFLYYRAARQEERQFATSNVADAYTAYRHRSGMFWPRLASSSTPAGSPGR
jgi:protein-S-isoprenylcysteine O-methyltransferase Ste14